MWISDISDIGLYIIKDKLFLKNDLESPAQNTDAMSKTSDSKKIVKNKSEGNVRLMKYLEALILIWWNVPYYRLK